MIKNDYMPKKDLRQLQLIQLEMLIEVDRICKNNDIKYCIIAGTLLGAVRHGGYIPWDDDADIAMLRPEYEKFCKICEEDLDTDRFYLQTHFNTKEYRWGYGKLRRKDTQYIRKGQEHMNYDSGVFIDLFPLDNVPNNKKLRRCYAFLCTIIRKLLWSKVGAKAEKKKSMRLIYKLLSVIPKNMIFYGYNKLVKLSSNMKTDFVRILTFPTPNNAYYGYYKKWYIELTNIEFEKYFFPAAKDYHGYLSFKFGNYNKLPPIEERKVHAASYYQLLDINKNISRADI